MTIQDRRKALDILGSRRVAVMIVAYNAEKHIESVLARIPHDIVNGLAEIYVLDDSSGDATYDVTVEAGRKLNIRNLTVFRTPANRGYGGNQKLGYTYAMRQGFDVVIMLHGDGQYAPECLPDLIAEFGSDVDMVLGSRMMDKRGALKGGMPFYKWIGNQLLTWFENMMLNSNMTEFHTGYRAFRVNTLRKVPFQYCSDSFHFDSEILIQFISAGCIIREVPIPTHYGDEVCHVKGLRYAWDCIKSVIKYSLFKVGLFYDPLLDFDLFESETYFYKKARTSLHQYVLTREFRPDEKVLDFGAAAGYMAAQIAKRAGHVTAVDYEAPRHGGKAKAVAWDLSGDFEQIFGRDSFDTVLALDVLEHLDDPEIAVQRIARILKPGGCFLASTGNIGYVVMRIMLLCGVFNYGKRGILDKTHKRLFTLYTFKHLLRRYGFKVEEIRGFGPPICDMISSTWPFSWLDSISWALARLWPGMFAYNFLITASRVTSLEEVYRDTFIQDEMSEKHEKKG